MGKSNIDKLLDQIESARFRKLTNSIWEALEWDGAAEEFNRESRDQWRQASLDVPKGIQTSLKRFDDDTMEMMADFEARLKEEFGYISIAEYDDGKITIVKPSDGKGLAEDVRGFESEIVERVECFTKGRQ